MFPSRACSSAKDQLRSMSPLRNRQLQLRDSATSHRPELGTRFARHCGGRSARIPRSVFQMSPAGWVTQPQNGSIKLIGNSATEFPPGIDSPGKAIGGESLEQQESATFLGCKRFSKNLWKLTNRSRFTTSPLASAIQTMVTFRTSSPNSVQLSAERLRRNDMLASTKYAEHWKRHLEKTLHPLWLN